MGLKAHKKVGNFALSTFYAPSFAWLSIVFSLATFPLPPSVSTGGRIRQYSGDVIQLATKRKRERHQLQQKLESHLESLSTIFKKSPTPLTVSLWIRHVWNWTYALLTRPNAFCAGPVRIGTPKRTNQIRCWPKGYVPSPLNPLLLLYAPIIMLLLATQFGYWMNSLIDSLLYTQLTILRTARI